MSSKDHQESRSSVAGDGDDASLYCRWRRQIWTDRKGKVVEEAFRHFRFEDAVETRNHDKPGCPGRSRIADTRARYRFRKILTRLGGSHVDAYPLIDFDGTEKTYETQRYTLGDGCCGAGGTSRGALMAGLSVKWGFDLDKQAIDSYAANFQRYGTDCRHEAVFDFLNRARQYDFHVDILHVSPPCQTFSLAKTVATPEQDEKNEAVLFSVGQLIETVKPRIVTMEETYGLLCCHREWFDALLHVFIHLGYSVRWKVLRCEEYGVPQARKRLVILAAGPGERLPDFPKPTHGENSASKTPLVTIGDSIRHLIPGTADHDLGTVCEFPQRMRPFSFDRLAATITTSGGQGNYHPDGFRHYTVREHACLQTFPLCHSFLGGKGITARKRQIGNAVPPALACAIFKEVVKCLKEVDEEQLRMSRVGLVK